MGFLNLYDSTEEIVVAQNPDDPSTPYTVTIKQFLTNEEYAKAQKALMRPRVTVKAGQDAETEATMESEAYQQVLVFSAVVSWNLTDRNDQPLPLTIESVRALPQVVFNKLYARINDLNKSSKEGGSAKDHELNGVGSERDLFREAQRGDLVGSDGRSTADTESVQAGQLVVGEARASSR